MTLGAKLLEARIAAARWQERAGAQTELVLELKAPAGRATAALVEAHLRVS